MLEGSAPGSLRATKADEPEMERMCLCARHTPTCDGRRGSNRTEKETKAWRKHRLMSNVIVDCTVKCWCYWMTGFGFLLGDWGKKEKKSERRHGGKKREMRHGFKSECVLCKSRDDRDVSKTKRQSSQGEHRLIFYQRTLENCQGESLKSPCKNCLSRKIQAKNWQTWGGHTA